MVGGLYLCKFMELIPCIEIMPSSSESKSQKGKTTAIISDSGSGTLSEPGLFHFMRLGSFSVRTCALPKGEW